MPQRSVGESALYVGSVAHARTGAVRHGFRYPIYLHLLDLDELPLLDQRLRLFGHNRWRPIRFHDRDHLGNGHRPIRENLASYLASQGVPREPERVLLLTQCRVLGYVFNPVSFFYCYGPDARLTAVVAEVHNTFGETHPYLLRSGHGDSLGYQGREKKVFHVSPFMSLDGSYEFELTLPQQRLEAQINLSRAGQRLFSSRMSLERRPLTDRALAALLLQYPLMPQRTTAAIHWQAFCLWLKGARFHSKPAYDPEGARRGVA